MANTWIEWVKSYAKKKNLTYGCAMSDPECKKGYADLKAQVKSKLKKLKNKP